MKLQFLDPDCKNTWLNFEDLVYCQEVWQEIKIKLDLGRGKAFLNQLTCSDEYLEDNLARSLRQKGKEILYSSYTHVVGYHGCRPRDPLSYQTKGIVPSNRESLISEACSLFEGIEGFDKALRAIGEDYLIHNEGKVGLLYSALLANDEHNRYTEGSEFIRSIANRLGSVAKTRYAKTGTPTLIKCVIPVDWLDNHTTFPTSGGYSNTVIEALIRMHQWPDDSFFGFNGGYMLTRAIPPESILDFIDMTNFINDEL